MNKETFVPRVCTTCPVHHVENCPECFGFGLYVSSTTGELIPCSAGKAVYEKVDNAVKCIVCGGTLKGYIKHD